MHYSYKKKRFISRKIIKKGIGFTVLLTGFAAFAYFFFPLLSFHIYISSAFASTNIEAPLPQRFVMGSNSSIGDLFKNRVLGASVNYKDARNWFPYMDPIVEEPQKVEVAKVNEYFMSIPSQKIEKAVVSATDYDLSKHLVQYFTTSNNPTEKGTSVIFGHSTLPQLFNPNDYTAIFANMHKIKNGDEIVLHVDGNEYKYNVFSVSITTPEDPNIFSQQFDSSYVTIVTCTPPGTTWKRLIVRASLENEK